jgi:ATP-dependent Clp protease ATP-binding subunit ClpX
MAVHRLLIAANYDVRKAESGIICLDEFDKIAKPKSMHGVKDISGEVCIPDPEIPAIY